MKALIQRVSSAKVEVDSQVIGEVGQGLLVLLGVDAGDDKESMRKLAERVLNYRIFSDADGKMNLSLKDIEGEMLVVSQFTLSADTAKGRRPSFTSAAAPELANKLYLDFTELCRLNLRKVETGRFGADMQVSLTNDGPVTFMLEV